jgi:hypothetical protein
MGGGGGGSTTSTGIDPFLKPYVEYGLSEGQKLYQSAGPEYYPGQTYIAPSNPTLEALSLAQSRAEAGSPLVRAAQQQQLNTIQGTGTNPFLAGALTSAYTPTVQAFQEATRGIESKASAAGRYGSDAVGQMQQKAAYGLGSGIGNSLANLAYGSSEAQATRAAQAAQNAPTLANADYNDIQKLLAVGQGTEQYQQNQLQADINRYNYQQQLPQMKLQNYANLFSNAPGGSTSTTTQSGGK